MNDDKPTLISKQTSRRGFLRMSATAAGAAGVLSVSGASEMLAAATGEPPVATKKIPLKVAGYEFDRVQALIDGRVQIEGCNTQFEIAAIGDMNTDVFSGPQSREVTEIGLHPFMLAYANDGFRDYSLLPVLPFRLFRHRSIFIRTDRGIDKPEDLRGKKIGTPGFSSTSLTWLRGILQHEYGVKPEEIQWVISSKDSSAKTSGKVSEQESMVPKGLSVIQQGHDKVARLFPNYRKTEQAYFAKTGIFPLMHAVAIRSSVVEANPWLPQAVFNAYAEAKVMMYGKLRKLGWATISLPWVGQEIEETSKLMGASYWPYGIEPNSKALEALFQYSHQQGFTSRRLSIEHLFHPSTLTLNDRV